MLVGAIIGTRSWAAVGKIVPRRAHTEQSSNNHLRLAEVN